MVGRIQLWLLFKVPLSRAHRRISCRGSLNYMGIVMENKITMLHWRIALQKNAFCVINSMLKIWETG